VHDLRVACRRLDATLRLWGGGPGGRGARQAASELRRAAGPVREAEVLRGFVTRRAAGMARVPAATRRAWLESLTASAGPMLLPAGAVDQVARSVETVVMRMTSRGVRVARARRRARRWRKGALAELRRGLEDGEAAALHRARLALKYWRYAEESLSREQRGKRGKGDRSRLRAGRIRAWQHALGALNDLWSLAGFLAKQGAAGQALLPALEKRRLAALERLRQRHAALAKH
jgi:CHAD domain-containing protein